MSSAQVKESEPSRRIVFNVRSATNPIQELTICRLKLTNIKLKVIVLRKFWSVAVHHTPYTIRHFCVSNEFVGICVLQPMWMCMIFCTQFIHRLWELWAWNALMFVCVFVSMFSVLCWSFCSFAFEKCRMSVYLCGFFNVLLW